MRIGIICPGRLGDIIMCLPIAKHLFDQGYEVTWPICRQYWPSVKNYINYVNWKVIDVDFSKSINIAKNVLKESLVKEFISLSFNIPGTQAETEYWLGSGMRLDEYRYKLVGIDLSEKYNLSYTRQPKSELAIMKKINLGDDFRLVHKEASSYKLSYKISNADKKIVFVEPVTSSVFDWIQISSLASEIICIESSFSNLIEQLMWPEKKKVLFLKKGHYLNNGVGLPTYQTGWEMRGEL